MVQLVVRAVVWLGHVRLILKADNENALQSLVRAALKVIRVEVEALDTVATETPQPYDSQSNGAVEAGIRTVRKDFRCVRLCLENRLGYKIPVAHPILAWLLRHVAFTYNILERGHDGLTPWQRVRGRA